MDKSFVLGVISLVRSALTGEKATLPDDFDFERAYRLAKSHHVIQLLYYGIINSDIKLEKALNRQYFAAACQNIVVVENQKFEFSMLADEFEKNGIDYMPLKGSVIRFIYPKPDMRSMGDTDILIRSEQYEKIVSILKKSGFTFVKENLNEICWDKNKLYFELHRYLVSPLHKDYFKFFGDGWQFAKRAEGSKHRYEMNNEDFFIFLFAHFAKHYRSSGIGIKHITDIWVYLREKPNMDINYVKQALEKLNLLNFYENIIRTVNAWFENKDFDEVTYFITEKIFASGAFGTRDSYVKSSALKTLKTGKAKNARIHNIFTAVFLPYANMCQLFPILKKAPILLPFMWIYRGLYTIIFKRKLFKRYCESIKSISNSELLQYEKELNFVGLDYYYEE